MSIPALPEREGAAAGARSSVTRAVFIVLLVTLALAIKHGRQPAVAPVVAQPSVSLAIARGAGLEDTSALAYNQPQVTVLGANHYLVSVVTTEMSGAETIPAAPVSITRTSAGWELCYLRVPLEAIGGGAAPVRLEFEVRGTLGNAPVSVSACAEQPAAAPLQPASRRAA